MPPKKKLSGISSLIGKIVRMESKYDNIPIEGILVSTDEDYLGIDCKGLVFYFSKQIIRVVTEVPIAEGK